MRLGVVYLSRWRRAPAISFSLSPSSYTLRLRLRIRGGAVGVFARVTVGVVAREVLFLGVLDLGVLIFGVVLRDRVLGLVVWALTSWWKGLARRTDRGGVEGVGAGETLRRFCSLRLTPSRLPLMLSLDGGGVGDRPR